MHTIEYRKKSMAQCSACNMETTVEAPLV